MLKIVSGGQTGVDRGALDAGLAVGNPVGGWVPEGRLAEDGPIAERYPLKILPGAGYKERTLQNVIDSDGTVIVYFGDLNGGTRLTKIYAENKRKAYLLIDGDSTRVAEATRKTLGFIREHGIERLNVAGPRASSSPEAYPYAYELIKAVLAEGEL